jgi:hypothetical protein
MNYKKLLINSAKASSVLSICLFALTFGILFFEGEERLYLMVPIFIFISFFLTIPIFLLKVIVQFLFFRNSNSTESGSIFMNQDDKNDMYLKSSISYTPFFIILTAFLIIFLLIGFSLNYIADVLFVAGALPVIILFMVFIIIPLRLIAIKKTFCPKCSGRCNLSNKSLTVIDFSLQNKDESRDLRMRPIFAKIELWDALCKKCKYSFTAFEVFQKKSYSIKGKVTVAHLLVAKKHDELNHKERIALKYIV